jgi:Ca2+-binding EF-hand superfamily protein
MRKGNIDTEDILDGVSEKDFADSMFTSIDLDFNDQISYTEFSTAFKKSVSDTQTK